MGGWILFWEIKFYVGEMEFAFEVGLTCRVGF
jgi:hypothetical protein